MEAASASQVRGRFGLRILAVFVACAVAPILLFSALAYRSVQNQLEEDAAAALRRDAKSAAMSIVERLDIASSRLDALAIESAARNDPASPAFSRIERVPRSRLRLSPDQWRHLAEGRFLLATDDSTSPVSLRLLKSVGDDVWVGTLESSFLYGPERIAEGERYWVKTQTGRFLFGIGNDARTREIVEPSRPIALRQTFELETGRNTELAVVWPLFLKNPYGSPELMIGLSRTHESIARPLEDFQTNSLAAILLAILGSTAIALRQIRRRVGPLDDLMQTVGAIQAGDLSARSEIRSGDELETLSTSIDQMAGHLEHSFETLDMLRRVSDALLRSTDEPSIRSEVVPAAVNLTGATEGFLFVRASANQADHDAMVELGLDPASGSSRLAASDVRRRYLEVARSGREPVLLVAPGSGERGDGPEQALRDSKRLAAVIVAPVFFGASEPIGVLELLFEETPSRERFEARLRGPLKILAAQTGAALHNVELIENLRELFEGIIRLTVDAIDKKSAYTGGHCRRVPILSELITEAVCSETEGPLKDFSFSDDERYELRIAALLHDCGKVSTPVHVMDKATKLETINDRIEFVRMRAEILRRDLELDALRSRVSSREAPTAEEAPWMEAVARLDDDIDFLERCNIGGERMAEAVRERIERLRERYRWTDRHGDEQSLLTDEETENLKIRRGTLNDRERAIINEHVTTTIELLEPLPFPPELRNVPAIAGAHHERVNGTGYPLGLAHDAFSMQGRILALADVFEALTAEDRPYKAGKPLSETLRILEAMVEEDHIDRDLHEVFLRQNIHLRYAIEHVAPEQIDEPYRSQIEAMTAPWSARDRDPDPPPAR